MPVDTQDLLVRGWQSGIIYRARSAVEIIHK